jgi:Rne/Rng family ribonuclease
MPVTLLVSQYHTLRRTAYLKNGQIIDIDLEEPPSSISPFPFLDQIYWGRVTRTEATYAFVKLTENQVGLLPLEHPFTKLAEGQAVLVQVRREAIPDKGTQDKGPLLTRKIIFGSRYCLYHPFQEKHPLSSKIQDPVTQHRLQKLTPPHEPVTLREAAVQASPDDIQAEIVALRQKFSSVEALSNKAPCLTPYDAMPSSHRWMRDLEACKGNKILVDNDQALLEVRHFLKTHRPDLLPCVQKHHQPLFEAYGLEDFWDSLFQDVVTLPSGGNIVIDVTAAAIVIDVNQGDKGTQETNKEAIPFIVQQLKGRHLGGNIILDFIGLDLSPPNRVTLKNLLLKQASHYNLPLNILGWSKLGWMEARLPRRRLPLGERVGLEIK